MNLNTHLIKILPRGVDCSECKNCYIHPVAWGEYWCRIKEAKTGDGWVYELHSLKKRFKDNCEDFIKK